MTIKRHTQIIAIFQPSRENRGKARNMGVKCPVKLFFLEILENILSTLEY